jgi:hypothetical protein
VLIDMSDENNYCQEFSGIASQNWICFAFFHIAGRASRSLPGYLPAQVLLRKK